jgi:hypothetical protein
VLPETPVPLKVVPITIVPEVIAVTVSTVVVIEPVNTAVLTVKPPPIEDKAAKVEG